MNGGNTDNVRFKKIEFLESKKGISDRQLMSLKQTEKKNKINKDLYRLRNQSRGQVVRKCIIIHKNKKPMYQALVQGILLYGEKTWTLNTQQANKFLATEMGFWRRSARKLRKEKVRNVTIREIMEVGKNILEVNEEKRLRLFGHIKRMSGNRLPQKILEWEPEGTRRRERSKERWIYGIRRSMINHGLTEEDTRDRDRWRNLVLDEGKPL
jgi:hypothetical protein